MSADQPDSTAFYRGVADDYDEMTRFSERLPAERALLDEWRRRYGFASALDAACGTGLHAIAMAKLGVAVTGVDLSPEMLARAREHAAAEEVSVVWHEAAMEMLGEGVAGPFDALFCLGNSLPHLLDESALAATLAGFHRLLTPAGLLALQLINYEQVLAWQRRVVSLSRAGEHEYVRFYDFGQPLLRFNILQIDWSRQPPAHRLQSVPLYPWRRAELEAALRAAGFDAIEVYGDMKWGNFSAAKSQNLVMVAKR